MPAIRMIAIRSEGRDSKYANWAAGVLAGQLRERFNVKALRRPAGRALRHPVITLCETTTGHEGYRISTVGSHIRVEGESIGLLYGVGALLRAMRRAGRGVVLPRLNLSSKPAVAMRGVYLPIHYWYGQPFNSYTALYLHQGRLDELEAYLTELMLWGMNTLGLWYDEAMDVPGESAKGSRIWSRYKRIVAVARKLRLRIYLLTTVNLVPNGDVKRWPHLVPPRGPQGLWTSQMIPCSNTFCLSRPKARARIRGIRRRLFELFAPIDAVDVFPTDPGGCGCPACTPYVKAYADLATRILADAAAAGVPLRALNTWFFYNADARKLARFAARSAEVNCLCVQAAGLAGTIGQESTAQRLRLIQEAAPGLKLIYWPDITMEGNWGLTGSYPFAHGVRLLFAHGGVPYGVMPYSEGRYDDLNKFFTLSLAWNPRQTTAGLIAATLDQAFGERVPKTFHRAVALMERHQLEEAKGLLRKARGRVSARTRRSMLWTSLSFYTRHGGLFINNTERDGLKAAVARLQQRPSRAAARAVKQRIQHLRQRASQLSRELPALARLVNGLDRSDMLRCGTRPYTPEYLQKALGIPEAEEAVKAV